MSNVRVRLSMCHCLGIKSNRLLPKLNNNTLNKMLISVKCDRQNKHIRPNGKLRWFLRSPSPSLTLCHSTFFLHFNCVYILCAALFISTFDVIVMENRIFSTVVRANDLHRMKWKKEAVDAITLLFTLLFSLSVYLSKFNYTRISTFIYMGLGSRSLSLTAALNCTMCALV